MFIPFFVLPDRPTHLHEREGDGKQNIFLGMALRASAFLFWMLEFGSLRSILVVISVTEKKRADVTTTITYLTVNVQI